MARMIRSVLPLSCAVLLSSLGTSIANVALPTLTQVFDAPFQAVQWVALAYLLAMTALIVSAGRMGDMIGRRRLLLAGLAVFMAASGCAATAPDLNWLIAARAVQGAGAALMMALGMALVSESVPAAETGRAMGLLGTMSAIGTALGPTLGGVMIDSLGWPSIFLINLPVGAAVFVLVHRNVPRCEGPRTRGTGFDIPGMATLAVTLVAFALAVMPSQGQWSLTNLALLIFAACGLGVFVLIEIRARAPLIPLDLLQDGTLRVGLFSNAIVSTVLMSTLVVGPFFLTGALGLTAAMAGMVMSIGPALSALTGAPAGRFVDHIGPGRMSMFGLFGILSGCALLVVLPVSLGVAGYACPVAIITVSYALFQAANNTAVMKTVAPENRGVTSGMLNLSRNLGLVTGASAMAAVFSLGARGTEAGAAAVANGMRLSFTVSGALVIVALLTVGLTTSLAISDASNVRRVR